MFGRYWWHQHNRGSLPRTVAAACLRLIFSCQCKTLLPIAANASSATWQHHLDTYGPGKVYDDFIPSFGHGFNPKDLVDVLDEAGAKYFVLTSKHHDGFALVSLHLLTLQLWPLRNLHYSLIREIQATEVALSLAPNEISLRKFSMPQRRTIPIFTAG